MKNTNTQGKLLLLFCATLLLFCFFSGASYSQETAEQEYLAEVRPGPPDQDLEIKMGLVVVDIDSIDGAQQSFVANFAILASWKDPRLAKDIDYTRVMSADDVWTPVIQILNQQKLFQTIANQVEVSPDGTVVYGQRYWGTLSYPMNLEDFPSDRHDLQIRIVTIGKDAKHIRFTINADRTGMSDILTVTDWQVVSWDTFTEPIQVGPHLPVLPGVVFEFEAERLVTFYLVKVLIPLVMIILMSLVVLFIDPTNTGSRLSIAITAILTLIAYRFLLGSLLPKISYLTHMDYFIFGSMFLVFAVLIEACAVARLVSAEKVKTANMLDYWSRWVFVVFFTVILLLSFFIKPF